MSGAAGENTVGWFCVGFSSEVPVGKVVVAGFFGSEVVLYRGASGAIYAVEPHCPHLGAHLGYGGGVDGDNVVCPFHGMAFNPEGKCVKAYQEGKVSNGRVRHYRVIERADIIFVWNGPEEAILSFRMLMVLLMAGFLPRLTRKCLMQKRTAFWKT